VVLIHLGSRLPPYVRAAAAQVETVSGQAPLLVGPVRGRRYRGQRIQRFRRMEQLTAMGLSGFWRHTCERFFVLEEAMRQGRLGRCLHIESDNVLYVAPQAYESWLIETYGETLATCPLTETEDAASLMYVGSLDALSAFNDALLELVEMPAEALLAHFGGTMANEMRMIHVLRTEHDMVRSLPTTVRESREAGLQWVFDAASYGQWVDGTPPSPGFPYAGEHHIVGREILAGNYRVLWNAQRSAPFVQSQSDGVEMPLANLHIHSKRVERWVTEWLPDEPPPPPPPPWHRRAMTIGRRAASSALRHAPMRRRASSRTG
jgi:hypothetical protein